MLYDEHGVFVALTQPLYVYRLQSQALKSLLRDNCGGVEDVAALNLKHKLPLEKVATVASPKQRLVNVWVYPPHLVEPKQVKLLPEYRTGGHVQCFSGSRHGEANAIILGIPYYFKH